MRSRALAGVALLTTVTLAGGPATASTTASTTAATPSETAARPAPGTAPAGLRALADRAGLRIGTAVDMAALADDAPYRAAVAREFSTVTAENVMKWEATEPQQGVHDWAAADRLVDFARANRQKVRGHTLVWHNQNPAWVTEDAFTPEQLRAILRRHIIDEVTHFKGRVWHWDVVNEIFNDDGTWRDSIWLRNLGKGYVADAFRWAHQADPIKVQAQAQGFTSLLQACLLADRCVSYTLWGFTDRYSWVPGVFDGEGSATPFDENLAPKPAYAALRDTLTLAAR
jgi:endo-1,4-beta-xylanase